MSIMLKQIQAQIGYRFSNISFSEDGSISVSLQVCSVGQAEGQESTLYPIATQGYYLPKEVANQLMGEPAQEGEPASIRDVIESRVERHLRSAGQINF